MQKTFKDMMICKDMIEQAHNFCISIGGRLTLNRNDILSWKTIDELWFSIYQKCLSMFADDLRSRCDAAAEKSRIIAYLP